MFQLGLLGQILKIYLSKKEGTYTMAIINHWSTIGYEYYPTLYACLP